MGARFCKTFAEHWAPTGIRLRLFTDADILTDPEVVAFRERERDAETANPKDIHHGVLKWSWKVFAAYKAAQEMNAGWLVWVDADVEFLRPPTRLFLDMVCPDDADVTFLGRPWAYASETGFVGYHLDRTLTRVLLDNMRHCYVDGEFRKLEEWGDAGVFDYFRGQLQLAGLVENDIASHCQGPELHVWPRTILRPFLRHNKGPRRKRDTYG